MRRPLIVIIELSLFHRFWALSPSGDDMCHLVCVVCGWDACTDRLRAVDATVGAAHTHDARRRSALGAHILGHRCGHR